MVMRVALLGRTKILYNSIDVIRNAGHEVVLIGTCTAAPEYDIKETDFENKAKELGAVFFNNVHINSEAITQLMKTARAEVAVSINWLTVIQNEAISCFKYGIINAHCGDLPRYRGNACPNWAILKGEKEYAISIHYMNPGELDSGDVLIKKKYPITKTTSIADIYSVMDKEIPVLFCNAVDMVCKGNIQGEKQSRNPMDTLRCYPRIPTDSFIDWNNTCEDILRNIKASTRPFQGAFCFYDELKIYILDADSKNYPIPCYVCPGQIICIDKSRGTVEIAASDGIIIIEKIMILGEEYKATDIFNSTRIRLNYCIPNEIYRLKAAVVTLEQELKEIKERLN